MFPVPTLPDNRSTAYFSYSENQASLPSASTHIRLLELYPSRHGIDAASASPSGVDLTEKDDPGCFAHCSSPLKCTISVTPIANPRPFKALSYTWGQPDKTHSIDIAGTRLGITASLDTALRHLRQEDEPVTLWIDQICINQEDASEKNEQVPLMAQIYSRAELVLVWLGLAADNSDALMDCWQEIGQAARDLNIESFLNKERLPLLRPILENRDPDDPVTVKFQALLDRAVPMFNSLLEAMIAWNERPWFRRVWTIQEQALGTRTFFLCGSKMVNLDLLPLAILIFDGSISRQGTNSPGDHEHIKLLAKAQNHRYGPSMALRRRRRNFVKGEGPGDDLYHLLKKAYVDGDAQATLPRDRIYGLLSIAVDADQLMITPNYTNSDCRPSFVDAARALVRVGRLEMLSFSQFPKDFDELPSWVPDWRSTLTHSYLFAFEDADRLLVQASGDTSVEVVPTHDPSVLGIRGLVVDTIEETGDVWEWEEGREARAKHLQTIKAFCERSSQSGHNIYESDERRAEAVWRVPVGDLYWTRQTAYNRVVQADKSDYEDCLSVLKLLAEGFEAVPPENRQQQLDDFFEKIPGQSNYSENMDKMSGKRPYVTRQGYVGLSSGDARPGDVVVILLGSRIPYVLRPSGNGTGYCFVGEAYCDGVMDGEMLTKRQRETIFIT